MEFEWIKISVAWLTALVMMLLSVIYPMRLYCQKKKHSPEHRLFKINRCLRKIHKPLGIVVIPLTFLHCRFSAQSLGMNMGTILLILLFLLLFTYVFRAVLKGKWMLLHRSLTIILWVVTTTHILWDTKRMNDFMSQLIGWGNSFWYFIGYFIVTLIVMGCMPKEKRKKILTYAPHESNFQKAAGILNVISRYTIMVLSVFLPISWVNYTFWAGNALYLTGLILATISMWQFSKEDLNRPITTGIYRITRNPMHVMGFVMNIGIALITNNIVFWVFVITNIVASYPMFFMQERFCLEKYGQEYADYMKKTPRILFIKTRVKTTERDR